MDESCSVKSISSIKQFYDGANIFITGGTGFLGKVVVEKLLRSCPGINRIYLMMRPKNLGNLSQRIEDYKHQSVFDRIRIECPSVLQKLRIVPGEIDSTGLGISQENEERLHDRVNIVLHIAAMVKFNARLSEAAKLNTLGTLRVLEFCTRMRHLKSVVHVSTAFCNSNVTGVLEERVYNESGPLPLDAFQSLIEALPENILDAVGQEVQKSHPNSYTLTKLMAERMVEQFSDRLPICIVRPSIILAAFEEPQPGWLDNINGVSGLVTGMALGVFRSIVCQQQFLGDVIPVDIVSNTIIVSAAWTNHSKQALGAFSPIKVIHCTSGGLNPITWKSFVELIVKWARYYPSTKAIMCPSLTLNTSRTLHFVAVQLSQYLPAVLLDLMRVVQGKPTKMFRMARRLDRLSSSVEFFSNTDLQFEVHNMQKVIEHVKEASDGSEFQCDVSRMRWSDYMERYLLGIRRNILKEGDETLECARKRIRRLHFVQLFVVCCLIGTILLLILM